MRKMFGVVFAMLLLLGSTVPAFAEKATPAADKPTSGSADTNPVNPQIGDPVTLFATNGDAIATITVTDVERNWEGYDEYQDPESGTEYIAVTIEVESTISRGAVEISPYDFRLQDGQSFVWGTSYARNEDSPKDTQVLSEDLSLAGGEKETFLIVFQTFIDQPLQHVYWTPDKSLLTLADLSDV